LLFVARSGIGGEERAGKKKIYLRLEYPGRNESAGGAKMFVNRDFWGYGMAWPQNLQVHVRQRRSLATFSDAINP